MTIKPERARGTFLGMVLAGAPLHPDAVRLSLRLTDERLASAFSLVAELELHRAGERFSIRRSGLETQRHAGSDGPGPDASSDGLYFDLDAVSTAVIVTALVAEME